MSVCLHKFIPCPKKKYLCKPEKKKIIDPWNKKKKKRHMTYSAAKHLHNDDYIRFFTLGQSLLSQMLQRYWKEQKEKKKTVLK